MGKVVFRLAVMEVTPILRSEIVRPANLITLSRLAAVPWVILLLRGGSTTAPIWAALLFVLTGITDAFDGRLARSRGETSSLGAMLDPLADKIMMVSVVAVLAWTGRLPLWLGAVLAFKEAALMVGAALVVLLRSQVVPARIFGKIATTILYIGVTATILALPFHLPLVVLGVLLSVWAGAHYAWNALRRTR